MCWTMWAPGDPFSLVFACSSPSSVSLHSSECWHFCDTLWLTAVLQPNLCDLTFKRFFLLLNYWTFVPGRSGSRPRPRSTFTSRWPFSVPSSSSSASSTRWRHPLFVLQVPSLLIYLKTFNIQVSFNVFDFCRLFIILTAFFLHLHLF